MASRNILNLLGQLAGAALRSLLSRGSAAPSRSRSSQPPAPARRTGPPTAAPTSAPTRGGTGSDRAARAELERRKAMLEGEPSPGQLGSTATVEVDPPAAGGVTIRYAPQRDGAPDAGEVVWTWIPYEERDGRGKDRPVLVIGTRDDDWAYVVRLTSKSHDGDRDFLSIGSGSWDSRGRESWVDIEQLYLVHPDGMRREASTLDRPRFNTVAQALQARYGWRIA